MFWLFHTVIYFLIHLKILFHFVSDMKNKKNKSSERVFSWFLSLSFFYFCICCFTHGEKNTSTPVLNKIWADLWLECQMVSKNPQRNASYHNLSKPQETDSIPPKREEKLPQTQKKKTPNYQSFKTSGFKTKTALPPHELKTTTDTKPPHTQIHKKLTQNRRKESETTRLKTTKLWDLKTKNTQTKRYESQNNCEEMQNYHCQTQKHEKDTQNHHKEMENYQRLKTVKTPKNA